MQYRFVYYDNKGDFMELKIEYVPIKSIKPYKGNAKLHPKEQIEQIAQSIQDMGFNDPIGIWHNEIVEGHGRYLAAKKLKIDTVPVIRLDTLTEQQQKAYRLIHNKLTQNTGDDLQTLMSELQAITDIDMSVFGFDGVESFDMGEIESFDAYDYLNNDNEYFAATFTFPTAQKEQISKYLRKHKQEITEEIMKKAGV